MILTKWIFHATINQFREVGYSFGKTRLEIRALESPGTEVSRVRQEPRGFQQKSRLPLPGSNASALHSREAEG